MRKSLVERDRKRRKQAAELELVRLVLKSVVRNKRISDLLRSVAETKLHLLPKNSSGTRIRNRCVLTGRPRGVSRRFKLCRNKVLQHFYAGLLPGYRLSS